jgi:hypothetical protein
LSIARNILSLVILKVILRKRKVISLRKKKKSNPKYMMYRKNPNL